MSRGDEKERRMQLRREIGNRVVEPPPAQAAHRGPSYLVAHACFACQVSFKRQQSEGTLVCPSCGGTAYEMGRYFKTPAKRDDKQWTKVRLLYAHGFRFWSSNRGDAPPLPQSLREVERFIADNPNHPYRVAEPISSLLE